MTIAHFSDLHFGRIGHPGVVDALVEEVNRGDVTLAVLSGDLTQRAQSREFKAAQELLASLDPPTLVVPGNHDVHPWWHPIRRLRTPLSRYQAYITDDLAPTFDTDGVAALGISTAHGFTIKSGRVADADRKAIRDYFGPMDEERFKVLVLHHHLTKMQSLGPHDIVGQARRTLQTAVEEEVDLILCGHLHVSRIEPVEIIPADHRVVVASAGTATSNRWRTGYESTNFYNRITISPEAFTIEERRYVPEDEQFTRDGVTRFDRRAAADSAPTRTDS
ncbi:MAG: transcriptional regulator [Bacteroidetes bacterium SW_9_63_38]|nr:MAG: transcriptional regulator [Bacteroidetes bacterium SW_9_63_38]